MRQKVYSPGRWGITGRRSWTLFNCLELSWGRDLAHFNPPFCLLAHRVVWNWLVWALKPDEPCSEVLDSHGRLVERGTVGLVFGAPCLRGAQWCVIPERVLSPAFLRGKWLSVPFVQTSHAPFVCCVCLLLLCVVFPVVWSWRWFLKMCSCCQTELWAETESPFRQKYGCHVAFCAALLNHPLVNNWVYCLSHFLHSHLSWIWKVKIFIDNRRKIVLQRFVLTFPNCYAALRTPFSDMQSSREWWQHSPYPYDWLSYSLRGSMSVSGWCLLKQEAWSLLALILPIRMWLIDCSELDIWPKWRK